MSRLLALSFAVALAPVASAASGDSPPFRYSYALFAVLTPGGGDDPYLPVLVTREPIEQGDRPEAAVLVTYERDGLWKFEPRTATLEPGAVHASPRRVSFRGQPYRYPLVSNSETVRLLEHPEGATPLHRREPPIWRDAEQLRDELLRDFAAAKADPPNPPAGPVATAARPGEALAPPAAPETAPDLVARLEVVDEPSRPWTEAIARVRLTVENRGGQPRRVLRLRPGWLEYNHGSLHGWSIDIEGPGGRYTFPLFTGAVRVPTDEDSIELAPGESFSTLLRLEEAACLDGNVRRPLASTPGEFSVTVLFDESPHVKTEPLKFTKK